MKQDSLEPNVDSPKQSPEKVKSPESAKESPPKQDSPITAKEETPEKVKEDSPKE